jgi:hypothetical protein
VTNYVTLLSDLDRWSAESKSPVTLCTFNYDTLLDDACTYALRMQFKDIGDYLKTNLRFDVLKLHGSWNWTRRTKDVYESPVSARALIASADELNPSDRYEINSAVPGSQSKKGPVHEPASRAVRADDFRSGHYGLLPALAMPMRTKSEFDCPAPQVEALSKAVSRARSLLVIGWRAQEEHFLNVVRRNAPGPLEVHIVSGSATGGQQVRDRLMSAGVSGNFSFFTAGFTDYLHSHSVDALLHGAAGRPRKRPKPAKSTSRARKRGP